MRSARSLNSALSLLANLSAVMASWASTLA
jgi:hypothetical protein